MSELHLNAQVYDTFQRLNADHKLTAPEARELRQAIEADGRIENAEQTLLDKLADPGAGALQLSGEGGRKTRFEPAGLHFEAGAARQIQQAAAAAGAYSQGFSQSWGKLLKTGDGHFSAADLKKLASQAKTPVDRSFVASLQGTVNGGVIATPEGLVLRTEAAGDGRRIVPESIQQALAGVVSDGIAAHHPHPPAVKTLLQALSSPSASLRAEARHQAEAALAGLSGDERSALQSLIREHRWQQLNTGFGSLLTRAATAGHQAEYARLGEQLPAFLAANEQLSDPQAQAQAYRVLAEAVRESGRKAGHSAQADPHLAQLETSMQRARQALSARGITADTAQQTAWAQARFVMHPQSALAELEKIALQPPRETPDQRREALAFLLEHSPHAQAIGQRVLAGVGQPGPEMRLLAATSAKAVAATYRQQLKDAQPEIRIQAVQALADFPDPTTVAVIKDYALHRAVEPQESLSANYALTRLADSPQRATAEAARAALAEIGERNTREYHVADQPPQAAGSLANLNSLLAQADPPYARILLTLADSQLAAAATDGLATRLEQAAAEDRRHARAGQASNRLGELQNQLIQTVGALQPPEVRKQVQARFQPLMASYTEPTAAKALQRIGRLQDRDLQADLLEQAAGQWPKDAGLKTWLTQTLKQPQLTPAERLNLERAHLSLDATAAARALTPLLKQQAELPEAGRRQLLASLLNQAQAHPRDASRLSPLVAELASGSGELFSPAQLQTLQQPPWQQRALYDRLLESPQQPVRRAALAGLAELAKAGDVDAVHALAWQGQTSLFVDEQSDAEALLTDVATAAEGRPELAEVGSQAQSRLSELADSAGARRVQPVPTPRETADLNKLRHQLGRTVYDYGEASGMQRQILAEVALEGSIQPLLEHGLPIQKAGYARMALDSVEDKTLARSQLLKILTSPNNREDFDEMMTILRGNRQQPDDLQSFFSQDQYAAFDAHRRQLYATQDHWVSRVDIGMLGSAADKGQLLGELIGARRDGQLGAKQSQDLIGHLLGSLSNAQEYADLLSALHADTRLDENALPELLGDRAYDELRARIGLQPPQRNYSDDEQLARQAQDFFDFVSTLPVQDDDYLSTDNLVLNHPEIREQPFYHQLENADLDARSRVIGLIADGKVKVAGVQAHFADQLLFHKRELGVFELSGDFHLKDFVSGSVSDKARQFIAIDRFAQMVHDTTRDRLAAQEEQLRQSAADPARLGQKLQQIQTGLKPYQLLLDAAHGSQAASLQRLADTTLGGAARMLTQSLDQQFEALIQAEQQRQGLPPLDKTALAAKKQQLQAADALLRQYGSDGARAAAKMRGQADDLARTAVEMGVAGDYAAQRIDFRQRAFAMYHDKDMDLLHQAYVEGLQKLGPDAAKVVGNAEKLEGEIETTKKYAKLAGHLAATLVGVDLVLQLGELTAHVGSTYRAGDLVDGVRRSQEAQDRAWDSVAFEAMMLAANNGFKGYQGQIERRIEAEAGETFSSLKGLDPKLVRNMEDTGSLVTANGQKLGKAELLDLFAARDVYVKNAKELVNRQIASFKVVAESLAMASTDQPPEKIFANLLIKGGFHQGLQQIPASEQLPYLATVGKYLLGPGTAAASRGLALLRDADQPLAKAQQAQADRYLTELRRLYPNLKLPARVTTEHEFASVLARVGAAGPAVGQLTSP